MAIIFTILGMIMGILLANQRSTISLQPQGGKPAAPIKREYFKPEEFRIAKYSDYNNDKRIVLEWFDSTSGNDVQYEIRQYTSELNVHPIAPGTTYNMTYYTETTTAGVVYYVSQPNVSKKFIANSLKWPKVAFDHYTKQGSYNAITVSVSEEKLKDFAVIAKKNANIQYGRAIRIFYQTPLSLQVDNLRPTDDSSYEQGVYLSWTNENNVNDGTYYDLKYFTASTGNPFGLKYYTYQTSAGMTYYVAEPNNYLDQEVDKFSSVQFANHGMGLYSAEVGRRDGMYVVKSINAHTNQDQTSYVVMFNFDEPQEPEEDTASRAEIAKIIATEANYPITECETSPYPDVPVDTWYCAYVKAMVESKVMYGYSDGLFHPEYEANRAEVAKMLITAFRLSYTPSDGEPHFIDINSNDWYYQDVEILWQFGERGYGDGSFRPANTATDEWLLSAAQSLH